MLPGYIAGPALILKGNFSRISFSRSAWHWLRDGDIKHSTAVVTDLGVKTKISHDTSPASAVQSML